MGVFGKVGAVLDSRLVKQAAHATFDRFDRNKDGKLNHAELVAALDAVCRRLGLGCSESKAHMVIRVFDKDNDGLISKQEFVAMLNYLRGSGEAGAGHSPGTMLSGLRGAGADGAAGASDAALAGARLAAGEDRRRAAAGWGASVAKRAADAVFDHFDRNKDGKLNAGELAAALDVVFRRLHLGHSKRASETMIGLFDTDGDGRVSKDEFERMVRYLERSGRQWDAAVGATALGGASATAGHPEEDAAGGAKSRELSVASGTCSTADASDHRTSDETADGAEAQLSDLDTESAAGSRRGRGGWASTRRAVQAAAAFRGRAPVPATSDPGSFPARRAPGDGGWASARRTVQAAAAFRRHAPAQAGPALEGVSLQLAEIPDHGRGNGGWASTRRAVQAAAAFKRYAPAQAASAPRGYPPPPAAGATAEAAAFGPSSGAPLLGGGGGSAAPSLAAWPGADPPGSPHAPSGGRLTLRIRRPFGEVEGERGTFAEHFAREAAGAVGVPEHRIRVIAIRPGPR